MAIEKICQIKRIVYEPSTYALFVEKQTALFEDGKQIGVLNDCHRQPFYPDQLQNFMDHVGKTTGLEIDLANAVWTEEVKLNYLALKQQLDAEQE